jgi:hypothetical protein
VIDVDVVAEAATMAQLMPYVSAGWREHLSGGGGLSVASTRAQAGYTLPSPPYRLPPRPGGGKALERARTALEADGVALAVLDAGVAWSLSGLANVVMAAELARAANDWLAEAWLAADRRFRGSVVVAPRDGAAAADEVRRLAENERWAQVVLAFPPVLFGDRSLYPLFEAAAEAGLPVCLQAGGGYAGANPGPTPTGFPTTTAEYLIDSAFAGPAHLASLVLEGVCERFPSLKVVFSGFGAACLPSLMWRLDAAFDNAAGPVAKLSRRPAELVDEHVRFTTRDLDAPSPGELLRVLPPEEAGRLLLYASGPLSRQLDAWSAVPELSRAAILGENAASWLRLPALETA